MADEQPTDEPISAESNALTNGKWIGNGGRH